MDNMYKSVAKIKSNKVKKQISSDPTLYQAQKLWLSQNKALQTNYSIDHKTLGSQENAGYHKVIHFQDTSKQGSDPAPVQGRYQLFSSNGIFTIQNEAGSKQNIYSITSTANDGFQRYPEGNKNPSLTVYTYSYQIIGSPLRVINMDFRSNKSAFTTNIKDYYAIPYVLNKIPFSFTAMAFGTSNVPLSPEFGSELALALNNTNAPSTVTASDVGAYLSSVVVYIDTQAMYENYPNRIWSLSIIGFS